MINPFGVISSVTPLISLSFRLWGNMFAGSLIMSLWFYMTQSIMIKIPYLGVINLLGGLTAVPLKMYFDLMSGVIQAMVFVLLTMVYWSFARGETSENTNK
jgi:F-type H+-transporting ATPase subunit a